MKFQVSRVAPYDVKHINRPTELPRFVKSRRNCAPWRGTLRRARVGASDATERVPPFWGSSDRPIQEVFLYFKTVVENFPTPLP
jgi:hypothetical protein